MAYIPARPFVADDPLAYFAAMPVPNAATARPVQPTPANRALDLMYGYYQVD